MEEQQHDETTEYEEAETCDLCDEAIGEEDEGARIGGFRLCQNCLDEQMDRIGERGLTLADFLEIDPADIEQDTYDEYVFEIDRHRTKDGISPESAREVVARVKALLPNDIASVEWQQIFNVQRVREEYDSCIKQWARVAYARYFSGDGVHLSENLDLSEWIEAETRKNPIETFAYHYIQQHWLPYDGGENNHLANTLYNIMTGESDRWYVRAYRAAWNGEEIEDERREYWTNSGEYLVVEYEEAEQLTRESLESLADEIVLSQVPENLRGYFDLERWIDDVISSDGFANELARDDGIENEHRVDELSGTPYYIYKRG